MPFRFGDIFYPNAEVNEVTKLSRKIGLGRGDGDRRISATDRSRDHPGALDVCSCDDVLESHRLQGFVHVALSRFELIQSQRLIIRDLDRNRCRRDELGQGFISWPLDVQHWRTHGVERQSSPDEDLGALDRDDFGDATDLLLRLVVGGGLVRSPTLGFGHEGEISSERVVRRLEHCRDVVTRLNGSRLDGYLLGESD